MKHQLDRFNLVIDVIDRVPKLRSAGAHVKERMINAILDNMRYAFEQGTALAEISEWQWEH